MKQLCFFIFLATFAIAKAQNIKPFPTGNAKWTFEQRVDPNGDLVGTTTYELAGDTLINNNHYDKLQLNSIYLGAIRYFDNQLYFYPPDSTRELLLFDFNAKVGDTIYNAFDGYSFWNIPILAMDSTYVNGELYRVWQTHCESWIEGIGGTWLWLYRRTQTLCFFQTIDLKCFKSTEIQYGICEEGVRPEFVNEKNRWHVAACGVDFGTGNYNCSLLRYFFQDTVRLNGKIYHKLYRAFSPDYQNPAFRGYYREDDAGNVYLLEFFGDGSSEEVLIYRFDLNVGDTIKINSYGADIILKVIAFDYITLESGSKRKRIMLEESYTKERRYWVEGMGSNYAPMDTRYMFVTDGALELACYQYDNEIEYETERCNLRTSTHEPIQTKFARIFPNPFTSELIIQADNFGHYTIKIFDSLGKLILQNQMNDSYVSLNTLLFPAGIYFLHIQDESGNFQIEKLVRQ